MTRRVAFCFLVALVLAGLTGTMDNCGTLRECLAGASYGPGDLHAPRTGLVGADASGLTVAEALETDRKLTALIGG